MARQGGTGDGGQARALIALNAGLLLALAAVTLGPAAQGQRAGEQRSRGQYTMVGGQVQGTTARGVYIVDARNRELVGVVWDQSRKALSTMGYRDIDADARRAERGGR